MFSVIAPENMFSSQVEIVWSSIHIDGDFSEYHHAVEQMKKQNINIIILQLHESMHQSIFTALNSAGMVSEGYAYFTTNLWSSQKIKVCNAHSDIYFRNDNL